MATDMTVAKTILAQLGGRGFELMTGARNFTGSDNALTFHLPANFAKNKARGVRITLEPSDTYTVEFLYWRGIQPPKTISRHEDIYNDMLRELFERETGLCLTVPRVRFA